MIVIFLKRLGLAENMGPLWAMLGLHLMFVLGLQIINCKYIKLLVNWAKVWELIKGPFVLIIFLYMYIYILASTFNEIK